MWWACPSRQTLQGLLLLLGLGSVWSGNAGEPGPVIPKGKGDRCVADTDFMRRNHMDLIMHQRDETVIRGIRDEPFSLVECVDCHVQQNASNEPVRIDADGQFCASCHTYAAVKIDCFDCHAAVPDTAAVPDKNDPERIGMLHPLSNKQWMTYKLALKSALDRDRDELNSTRPE